MSSIVRTGGSNVDRSADLRGLSTDTKPTAAHGDDVPHGSTWYNMDNNTKYMYNADTDTWYVVPMETGGDMQKAIYDPDLAVANAGGIAAYVDDKIGDVIDDTTTDNDTTWSSTKINTELSSKCDNSVIADVENDTTASQDYAIDDQFMHNGQLMTATSTISQGNAIVVYPTSGYNCKLSDSVTEQIASKADKSSLGTASTKNSTSVVTESTDLVESGAVYDAMGFGNKNQLKLTLTEIKAVNGFATWSGNTMSYNGGSITFIEMDGFVTSISISGTVTSAFNVRLTDTGNLGYQGKMLNGTVDTSKEYLFAYDEPSTISANDSGNGITIPDIFTRYRIVLNIKAGTHDNEVVYPMISVNGGAYEPYHLSVNDTLRNAEVIEGENFCLGIPLEVGTISAQGGDGDNDARVRTKLDKKIKFNESREVIFTFSGNASEFAIYQYDSASADTGSIITGGWVSSGYTFTPNISKYYRLVFKKADGSATMSVSDVQNLVARYNYLPLKDVVPTKADNSVIGTVEDGTNPTKSYAVGEHMIRGGKFCTVTSPVTTSSTWVDGSNYTSGDVAELLAVQSGTPTPKTGVTIGDRNTIHKVGSIVIMNIYVLTDLNGTSKSLFTLPSGFTPSNIKNVLAFDGNGAPLGRIYITDGGEVGIATSQTQSNIYINATVSYVI